MTCLLFNKDPTILTKNMGTYFKQMPPDCSLLSEDGAEFLVHRELLYQTKFMRRMLKSANLDSMDSKIEIMCPSLSKLDVRIIAKFLYSGEIFCPNELVATQIFTNLQELFGFPPTNFQFDGVILKSELQDVYCQNVSDVFKLPIFLKPKHVHWPKRH